MKQQISLNGKWNVVGISPKSETFSLYGTVPGHIHRDLERENIIPNMFWRDNAEKCQWVEECVWTYSREFKINEVFNLQNVEISFDGLDTYSRIEINDENIGESDNMFTPFIFDITKILKVGTNTIKVTFHPYTKMIGEKPFDEYPAAFSVSERVFVRRMQCTFYWDWVNRFVSVGMWKDVTITSYQQGKIEDVFIYTNDIAKTSASQNISITTQFFKDQHLFINLEIRNPNDVIVWQEKFKVWGEKINFQADIENPELWWPNGNGNQPIYQCKVRLLNSENIKIDEKIVDFGIRTLRIEMLKDKKGSREEKATKLLHKLCANEIDDDEVGKSFTILVNGERIYIKGSNWVPASPFPSEL